MSSQFPPDPTSEPNPPREQERSRGAADRGSGRIEELGTYEMIWDCKFCGSTNLPAKTHKFCPNCGAAQDPNTRRFPSDEEKRAVENYVYKGASLICASCSTPNEGDAQFCIQCGAPLTNAQRAERVGEQVKDEGEHFAAQAQRDLSQERFETEMRRVGVIKDGKKGTNRLAITIIIGVIALIVGAIFILTRQRDESAGVIGHRWERLISIEQYAPRESSAWCDAMPADAYNVTSRREQRSTRRVPDGEDCQIRRVDNGDGTFSERRECTTLYREEPVYDDRCYFTVNRWDEARVARAQGTSLNDTPYWPQTNLRCTGQQVGCERKGDRDESYTVILQGMDNDRYECAVPQALWQQMAIESRWALKVGVVTGAPDCDSLEPAG